MINNNNNNKKTVLNSINFNNVNNGLMTHRTRLIGLKQQPRARLTARHVATLVQHDVAQPFEADGAFIVQRVSSSSSNRSMTRQRRSA